MTVSGELLVVDASAIVAVLTDGSHRGQWAAASISRARLAGPSLLPFEAANALRRLEQRGLLSQVQGDLAHRQLLDLPLALFPYSAVGTRVWQLRGQLTPYDGAYVALAEALGVPLITVDLRLARADGPTCQILTPPEPG